MLGDGGSKARDILGEVRERRRRGEWGARQQGEGTAVAEELRRARWGGGKGQREEEVEGPQASGEKCYVVFRKNTNTQVIS
jgi:hypothetical protein